MPDNNFKKKTTIGLLMAAIVVVSSKVLSLSSQWILGFLLEPSEFGIYGMVIGVMAFVGALQEPGLGRVHTQLQSTTGYYWRLSLKLSLMLNFVGAILLVILCQILYNQSDTLFYMSLIVAAGFPIIGLYALNKARLEIAKDYKSLATFQLLNSLSFNGAVVIAAYLGTGPFSFCIAILTAAIVSAAYIFLKLPKASNQQPTEELTKKSYYNKVVWSLIGAILLGYCYRIDYVIVGASLGEYALGIYYFGFMLAANVGIVLSQAMVSVLMPAFSSLTNKGGSEAYYVNGCRKILVVAVILSFSAMLLLAELVSWIWQGKWDEAIPICQLFLITLPLKLLVPVSISYLESIGKWKLKAFTLVIDGITISIACYVGALLGGLMGASIGVAAQRGTFGLTSLFVAQYIASRKIGLQIPFSLFKDILLYGIFIGLGTCLVLFQIPLIDELSFNQKLILLFASYMLVTYIVNPSLYKSLFATVLSLIPDRFKLTK